MKITFVFFLVLFITQIAIGQSQIKGKVTDSKGMALLGVNVYFKNSYDGGSTDVNGNFHFSTELAGHQIIIASFIGYKSFEKEVELSNASALNIMLEEEINKIDGVTISAGAFEASDKKKSVVLKTLDIVSTAGATADITGVMNTLPGTQTVGEEGRLFVRGGAGHEAKTFINGLMVVEPYGLTPQNVPSRFRFSPFLFKGAFFSTGGYSAEYGQALSSVLQLKTYDLPSASQTDISVMSVGTDISQTIRKKNTSVYGQVQYTDLTGYYALVPQEYEWDRAPNSFSSTLHFKQKFGEFGSIQSYTNYEKSNMSLYQPSPGNFNKETKYDIQPDNLYSNLAVSDLLGEKLSYRGGVSFTLNSNHIKIDNLDIETRTMAVHSKFVFDHDISEHIQLKYGGEWIANEYEEDIEDHEGQQVQNSKFRNQLLSPFAEADIFFSNNLVARIGARYEYNDLINTHSVSPRLSLAYKNKKNSQVSLAYGMFSQLPIKEYLKWSNKLSLEKATHYILNYQFSKDGQIFRTEAYYKKYDQLTTIDGGNEYSPLISNGGYGDAKGFELFWRDSKTFQAVDYWISYSYLDTKRKYDVFPYPVMPYYASAHNLSIVYKHFISQLKSQVGWTYSFASGRPYTDPNTGQFNNKMTKNYNDLSINWSYLIKSNMIIHASVTNVLGFNNVFGYQYNVEPNENGIYESMPIEPQAKRFLFIGFFFTLSKDKSANMLNNL